MLVSLKFPGPKMKLLSSTIPLPFLLLVTLTASTAAAASVTQPRCTDAAQDEYQLDGLTPKPTSAAPLLAQRAQTSNSACGILQGNSGTYAFVPCCPYFTPHDPDDQLPYSIRRLYIYLPEQ